MIPPRAKRTWFVVIIDYKWFVPGGGKLTQSHERDTYKVYFLMKDTWHFRLSNKIRKIGFAFVCLKYCGILQLLRKRFTFEQTTSRLRRRRYLEHHHKSLQTASHYSPPSS
jgi:hypothetical protein